jgi:hypothetical protein
MRVVLKRRGLALDGAAHPYLCAIAQFHLNVDRMVRRTKHGAPFQPMAKAATTAAKPTAIQAM